MEHCLRLNEEIHHNFFLKFNSLNFIVGVITKLKGGFRKKHFGKKQTHKFYLFMCKYFC